MRKTLIIVSALLFAFLAGELVIRYIIRYPVLGVKYKVHYRQGPDYWTNVWKPYSRYWNVEGGNTVFQRNNLGLPGTNVSLNSKTKVAVLGTSFLEAYQINPQHIAVSVFDNLLRKKGNDVGVYNLGYSGHDPFDLWFRLKYFENFCRFDNIILVIESDFANRWTRYRRPLVFEPGNKFGVINTSPAQICLTGLRNVSAFLSIVFRGLTAPKSEFGTNTGIIQGERTLSFTPELAECLMKLQKEYGDRFALVTIMEQPGFNIMVENFCRKAGINYFNQPLFRPEIMIRGAGHLNEKGNQELGLVMFEAYEKFWGQNSRSEKR
jgi:hypothetical protein